MSSFLIQPKFCSPIITCRKPRFHHHSLQIRAQIPRDHEGRSRRIVDANLHLLKVRIEAVRNKERLERCCVAEQGWNYGGVESLKSRRNIHQEMVVEFLELLGVAGATFGFTILACSLSLCIISFLLHLNQ